MDFIKKFVIRTGKFLDSNYLYIFWFMLYFTIAWRMFGADEQSFIFVSVVYTISISIALSPIGEVILRITENCRKPKTEQEQNYLIPMFEQVYEDAKEVYPELNDGINIYIMDAMYINAFAIGRKTIAVTKGALETFTADELRGVLAHEFGHILYGHTKALLLSVIGNFIFTIIVWLFRLVFLVIQVISEIVSHFNWLGLAFGLFNMIASFLVEISVLVFINLSQIILSLNSRRNEYEADTFAYEIGYGRELIMSLYLLQKISINRNLTLSQKMKASHPHVADRIQNLEKLENQPVEE